MRVLRLVSALLAFTGGPAFAQEPIDYVSKLDFFSINFPSEPKVEQATYPDEYRLDPLPARVYTADQGRNHYKVTVVDYRDVSKMHAARNAKCVHDVGADKPGLTPQQRVRMKFSRSSDAANGPMSVQLQWQPAIARQIA